MFYQVSCDSHTESIKSITSDVPPCKLCLQKYRTLFLIIVHIRKFLGLG